MRAHLSHWQSLGFPLGFPDHHRDSVVFRPQFRGILLADVLIFSLQDSMAGWPKSKVQEDASASRRHIVLDLGPYCHTTALSMRTFSESICVP